jgi:hypothetical protein
MPNDDHLTEAIRLIRAGRKAEAQLVLEPYIQANPQDISAWMWEAEIFPADCDKVKVLEICLEHNPGHPQVSRALAALRLRAGLPAEPEPSPLPPEPEPIYPIEPDPRVPVSSAAPDSMQSGQLTPSRPLSEVVGKKRKHPDWPLVDGVVNTSTVRAVRTSVGATYFADIMAMYVVGGRDYSVKHPYARKGIMTPFDHEILVASYPPGTGVQVSYNPRNPGRAWVDEWDGKETKKKLSRIKDRPEVRQALAKRYRSRMLTGILWAGGGIAATVIGTLVFSQLGFAYVVFYGAIIFGIISFFSGLFGWLKYM